MSLLVVPPPNRSTFDKLFQGSLRRSLSQSKSTDSRPTRSLSGMSQHPTNNISNDHSPRRSSASGGRRTRALIYRLRSASNASISKDTKEGLGLKGVDDWVTGFQKYNQLITQIDQPYARSEFVKASKQLTKNCGGNFIHGLPEALFDLALLWCPASATTSLDRDEPSWSWISHNGRIIFPFDPTSSPDTTTLPKTIGPTFRSEIQNFHIGPPSNLYTIRRDKHPSLRIQYPPYFHAPRGTDPTLHSTTLRFTTTTIPATGFTASQFHYRGRAIGCSQLLDPEGRHAGVLMAHESTLSEPHYAGPYEFVALSRNRRVDAAEHTRKPKVATMHPPGTPIWDGERFVWDEEVVDFDEEVFGKGDWCVMNVLLVKWDLERGVAERVAVGRIHEDAWETVGPAKKEIVLR